DRVALREGGDGHAPPPLPHLGAGCARVPALPRDVHAVGDTRAAEGPHSRPGGGVLMADVALVELRGVSHSVGGGELRRRILRSVDATIGAGEIVIVTGPSGSGKTTLLTLVGALRSAQEGSL